MVSIGLPIFQILSFFDSFIKRPLLDKPIRAIIRQILSLYDSILKATGAEMNKLTEQVLGFLPHGQFTSQDVATLFPGSDDRRYGLVMPSERSRRKWR